LKKPFEKSHLERGKRKEETVSVRSHSGQTQLLGIAPEEHNIYRKGESEKKIVREQELTNALNSFRT